MTAKPVLAALLGAHVVLTASLWVAYPFADDTCLTNDCETRKSFVEAFGLISGLSLVALVASAGVLWLAVRNARRTRIALAGLFVLVGALCTLMGFVIPTQE